MNFFPHLGIRAAPYRGLPVLGRGFESQFPAALFRRSGSMELWPLMRFVAGADFARVHCPSPWYVLADAIVGRSIVNAVQRPQSVACVPWPRGQ